MLIARLVPLLSFVVLAAAPLCSQTSWHDARKFSVEGQAFERTAAPFDRLPARAEKTVRKPVWRLSRHSAGILIRFASDASSLRARWTLTLEQLAMPHMPASGVSGLDLYVKHEGRWRWLANGRPSRFPDNEARLISGLPSKRRDYLLYLPLYNGVSKLEIGVPKGSAIAKGTPPKHTKPIVFYGTSITHGACASRPGTCHTAILGRRFDRPVINLGFSGNGTMDASMGELLAQIDAALFVIDCLPNMNHEAVTERSSALIRALRKARPSTPILLVEDRTYSSAFLNKRLAQRNQKSRAALRAEFDKLRKAGVTKLHYLEGDKLLGKDGDDTVDGSHPTDLGFARQAAAFAAKIRSVLER